MITIKDIAKLACVSQSTVSKALNNRPDVSERTKTRILAIVEECHYCPNAFGKALKSRITGNIGIIFSREQYPLSGNPFYSRVLEGIEAELALNNYNLVLNIIPENAQKDLPKVIRERQVDGLILSGFFKNEFLSNIIGQNVPIVLVDPKRDIDSCSQVFIDNEHGAFLATQYLIDAGHRKIGFISGDMSSLSFEQRFNGYKKALKFNKIETNDKLIRTGGFENGYDHVKSILMEQTPTAIFAANDINAIHGYKAITDMNLSIPDDISIIGFDDIDLAKFANPPLTTIRVYKEELGSIAVRTLLKIINTKQNKPDRIIVPIKLIERESVKRLKSP